MGKAELSVNNIANEAELAQQAAAQYRSRGIPSDWYVDPADPQAAQTHQSLTRDSLEDAATAFLAAHQALGLAEADPASELENGFDGGLNEAVPLLSGPKALAGPSVLSGQNLLGGLFGTPDDFSDEGELGWQSDALCAQTDPEAFFPEKGGSTRDAKKVCGACNVRAQCLEYALANDERFGIWGGLSERERRRLRKRAV